MAPVIKETELREKYKCYGHFYRLALGGKIYNCRSILEIINIADKPSDINTFNNWKPDLIFIMMNPGSSEPRESHIHQNSLMTIDTIGSMKIELVEAVPDNTQFQIMRIMEHFRWNHARILNLSDLRAPGCEKFYHLYLEAEAQKDGQVHSCFSIQRSPELKKKLNIEKPVYAAWGVDNTLNTLIDRCLNSLPKEVVLLGIEKEKNKNKFYHPLLQGKPMNQEKWLDYILSIDPYNPKSKAVIYKNSNLNILK